MAQKVLVNGPGIGLFGRLGTKYLQNTDPIHGTNVSQISFGVAPAAAAFAVGLRSPLDHILLTFFVLCGLTRLARFNVTVAVLPKDKSGKSKYFEGIPIPTTLGIDSIMAYWVSQGWILDDVPLGVAGKGTPFEIHPIVGLFVLWGCLMVSKTIRIPKP